eukprot:3518445-Amphidinium_carterae.1
MVRMLRAHLNFELGFGSPPVPTLRCRCPRSMCMYTELSCHGMAARDLTDHAVCHPAVTTT